jgi:hypothetical protein
MPPLLPAGPLQIKHSLPLLLPLPLLQGGIPGLAVPDGEEHPVTSNIDSSRAISELGLQYHDPADTFVSMARSLIDLGVAKPLLS